MKTSNIFENLNLSFSENASYDNDEFSEIMQRKTASRNQTRTRQAVRGEKYFTPSLEKLGMTA